MAILENRSRTNSSIEFLRFLSQALRRSFVAFLMAVSLYLVYFITPNNLPQISLELSGNVAYTGFSMYNAIANKINSITGIFVYLKNLESENIRLKLENARLQNINSINQSAQIENLELKAMLKIVEGGSYDYINARLLSVSSNPFSKTALISAGSKAGVEIDQIVTNTNGLLGRIVEVSDNYSKIMLINDLNSRVPVVTSISKERGILAGNGDSLTMIYLSENHTVKAGEKLITSGDGVMHPHGIEVAKVIDSTKKTALVKSAAVSDGADFVMIIKKRD